MNWLSDSAMNRLRRAAAWPALPPRYEIVEELGQGGMGSVYLAQDSVLQREVAVKVIHPGRATLDARRRMMREARILAQLEHPGIVPVHDVGELDDGRIFYAMKRVRGERLDEVAAGVEEVGEVLKIFERLCETVAFAHAHGVIHRDLKPSNIMVGSFGEVLVMDWGVAKFVDDTSDEDLSEAATVVQEPEVSTGDETVVPADATRPGTILGTPGYMAPEQERGQLEQVDRRADVYALGAILRALLHRFKTPRRLEALCQKALSDNPRDRYENAQALGRDVSRYRAGVSISAYQEGPVERLGRVAFRYRVPLLLVGTYLVVRALMIVFLDV